MRMTLTAPAAIFAADAQTRRLAGVAIPYGEQGYTSAGPVTIDAGAIRVPANLRAVKLFRDHGRTTPVGYATDVDDTATQLDMGFTVARTPDGDLSLLEAREGVRDALSVELNNVELDAGHVVSADLVAVAQVPVPAFAGARLTASLTDDEQAQVYDLAQQIMDTTTPTEPDQPDQPDQGGDTTSGDQTAAEQEEETMTDTTTEAAAAPAGLTAGMIPAERTPARRGPRTLAEFSASLAGVMQAAGDASQVNAALTDIIPANTGDPGGAFLRPIWLGELWTPRRDSRHFLNVFNGPALTSMTWEGWKWETYPTVDTYAGNKTPIPTSPAAIVPATGAAERIAGGWDVDRIYEDFNTGFIAALLEAATFDYAQKSEAKLVATLVAEATDAGSAVDVPAGLQALAAALASVGAQLSTVAMATDVFADFLGIPVNEVPWWLTKQSVVDLSGDGSTDVAGIVIDVVPSLAAGTMLGADANAVDFRETGPFRVQAVNIPNGGIDVALFGYQGQIVRDDRGIVKVTVAAEVTP